MRRLVPLSLAVLAGCASSKGATERPTTQDNVRVIGIGGTSVMSSTSAESPEVATVRAPLDSVWRVLPSAYATLGIPVTTVDPTNHLLGNTSLKVRRKLGTIPLSRYLDCGMTQSVPSADTYEVQLSVVSRVGGTGGSSTVTTTVEALAKPVSFAGDNVRCSSTGALESRLATLIGVELRQ